MLRNRKRRKVIWSMANNVIAYVGIENFDTILYLSRILQGLNRKVLIVDNSETLALTYSIPVIKDMDTYDVIFSYRRVDFTNQPVTEELIAKYDDILIDCGLKEPITSINFFTKLIYVTDLFAYNVHRFAKVVAYYNCDCDKELLIRNAVNAKISVDHIVQQMNGCISEENVEVLNRDEFDYENTLNNHINQVFTLKLSRMYKEYLISQVVSMCNEYTKKEIIKAYGRARNGG